MKTLGDVFRDLSYGPLSGLVIGSEGSGTIATAQQDRVVGLLNQGLKRIYTRFVLSRKDLVLRDIEDVQSYPLLRKHAESDPEETAKFIVDTAEDPYLGDLLRVLSVKDEDGVELFLNMQGCKDALSTPKTNTLRIPEPEGGKLYSVHYQAAHALLEGTDQGQGIYLPEPLYEALEAFVAHKITRAMAGEENRRQSSELFGTYEGICEDFDRKDQGTASQNAEHTKLELRGFR